MMDLGFVWVVVSMGCTLFLISLFHEFGHWVVAYRLFGRDRVTLYLDRVHTMGGDDLDSVVETYSMRIENRGSVFLSGIVASLPISIVCFGLMYVGGVIINVGDTFSFVWLFGFFVMGVMVAVMLGSTDLEQYKLFGDPEHIREYVEDTKRELEETRRVNDVLEKILLDGTVYQGGCKNIIS